MVEAGGEPVRVPGGRTARRSIADWDGDGRWDILSGAATGGGLLVSGTSGSPDARSSPRPWSSCRGIEGIGYSEFLDTDEEPRPGIRSQIDVVDYDGDGKLDLLVGDFCTYLSPATTSHRRNAGRLPTSAPGSFGSSRPSRNGTGRCRRR